MRRVRIGGGKQHQEEHHTSSEFHSKQANKQTNKQTQTQTRKRRRKMDPKFCHPISHQEYRKHFPFYMKDHSSHDVLLMCLACHQLANLKDHLMRLRLAEMCDAPMGTMANVRCLEDADLKKVKSFGKALSQTRNRVPEERRLMMISYLAEYYQVTTEEVDQEILQRAANMDTTTPNENFKPHGQKVRK